MKLTEHDNESGITTTLHVTDGGKVAIQKTWDAEPLIEAAAQMRQDSYCERWGDVRHVGYIPMAELGKMMRQDGGFDKSRVMKYLQENPALVTFERALLK